MFSESFLDSGVAFLMALNVDVATALTQYTIIKKIK